MDNGSAVPAYFKFNQPLRSAPHPKTCRFAATIGSLGFLYPQLGSVMVCDFIQNVVTYSSMVKWGCQPLKTGCPVKR